MRWYHVFALAVVIGLTIRGVGFAADRIGFEVYSVLSESMAPAYRAGDLVLIQRRSPVDYRIGEALVYRSAVQTTPKVLHRLVSRQYQGGVPVFSMQGDAVTQGDPLITAGAVVGAARWRLPYVGFLLQMLTSRTAVLVRAVTLSCGIIYLALSMRHAPRR